MIANGYIQQSHTLQNVCLASIIPHISPNLSLVAKTRSQLNRRLPDGKKLPWPPFGRQWYAGCTTMIIGNSVKAGVSESNPPTSFST